VSAETDELDGIPATMLVAASGRALSQSTCPELGFDDPVARRILAAIGRDARVLASPETVRGITYRSLWFDRVARTFFERHPDGVGINLGCGLNTNFDRIAETAGGRFGWIDVDLPEAIAIRRRFFTDTARRRMQTGDLTAPDFFETLRLEEYRHALIVAEGVLYYLEPHDGETFFKRLASLACDKEVALEVACDIASPLTVRLSARGDLRSVRAGYRWGVQGPHGILRLHRKLELIEAYDFCPPFFALPHHKFASPGADRLCASEQLASSIESLFFQGHQLADQHCDRTEDDARKNEAPNALHIRGTPRERENHVGAVAVPSCRRGVRPHRHDRAGATGAVLDRRGG
jgi:O-methyltransferase involved in polyketide biosynthesis